MEEQRRLLDIDKAITDLLIAQGRHEERIADMEDYRIKQNGALLRVERKIWRAII